MNKKYSDIKEKNLFLKYKSRIKEAREKASELGYIWNGAIEKSSVHEAYTLYKTVLEESKSELVKMKIDYAVSSLINTITVLTILKAIDMGG